MHVHDISWPCIGFREALPRLPEGCHGSLPLGLTKRSNNPVTLVACHRICHATALPWAFRAPPWQCHLDRWLCYEPLPWKCAVQSINIKTVFVQGSVFCLSVAVPWHNHRSSRQCLWNCYGSALDFQDNAIVQQPAMVLPRHCYDSAMKAHDSSHGICHGGTVAPRHGATCMHFRGFDCTAYCHGMRWPVFY